MMALASAISARSDESRPNSMESVSDCGLNSNTHMVHRGGTSASTLGSRALPVEEEQPEELCGPHRSTRVSCSFSIPVDPVAGAARAKTSRTNSRVAGSPCRCPNSPMYSCFGSGAGFDAMHFCAYLTSSISGKERSLNDTCGAVIFNLSVSVSLRCRRARDRDRACLSLLSLPTNDVFDCFKWSDRCFAILECRSVSKPTKHARKFK